MSGKICLIHVFLGEIFAGFSAVPMVVAIDAHLGVKPVMRRVNWYLWKQGAKEFSLKEGETREKGQPFFSAAFVGKDPNLSYAPSIARVIDLKLNFGDNLHALMEYRVCNKGGVEQILMHGEKAYQDFYASRHNVSRYALSRAIERGMIGPPLPQIPVPEPIRFPSLIDRSWRCVGGRFETDLLTP